MPEPSVCTRLLWIGNHPKETKEKHPFVRKHIWGDAQCPEDQKEIMSVADLERLRETHVGLYEIQSCYRADNIMRIEAQNWMKKKRGIDPNKPSWEDVKGILCDEEE